MSRYRFSLILTFWICVAFVLGRVIARFVPRVIARVASLVIAVPLIAYVFWTHITWHVTLIPLALVLGVFTHEHQKVAPGVF